MDDTLATFREEYLTTPGSNSKDLSPSEICDTISEILQAAT